MASVGGFVAGLGNVSRGMVDRESDDLSLSGRRFAQDRAGIVAGQQDQAFQTNQQMVGLNLERGQKENELMRREQAYDDEEAKAFSTGSYLDLANVQKKNGRVDRYQKTIQVGRQMEQNGLKDILVSAKTGGGPEDWLRIAQQNGVDVVKYESEPTKDGDVLITAIDKAGKRHQFSANGAAQFLGLTKYDVEKLGPGDELRDKRTGALIATNAGSKQFSPDANWKIEKDGDGNLRVWDARNGTWVGGHPPGEGDKLGGKRADDLFKHVISLNKVSDLAGMDPNTQAKINRTNDLAVQFLLNGISDKNGRPLDDTRAAGIANDIVEGRLTKEQAERTYQFKKAPTPAGTGTVLSPSDEAPPTGAPAGGKWGIDQADGKRKYAIEQGGQMVTDPSWGAESTTSKAARVDQAIKDRKTGEPVPPLNETAFEEQQKTAGTRVERTPGSDIARIKAKSESAATASIQGIDARIKQISQTRNVTPELQAELKGLIAARAKLVSQRGYASGGIVKRGGERVDPTYGEDDEEAMLAVSRERQGVVVDQEAARRARAAAAQRANDAEVERRLSSIRSPTGAGLQSRRR